MDKHNKDTHTAARDAANIRLAIGLGVFAFAIYAGFIFMHWLK